jgi:uncharacterized protein YbcI
VLLLPCDNRRTKVSRSMPGFEFRYRLGGGDATSRSFVFKHTETLSRGDMLNVEGGAVDLGADGDVSLIGAATETLEGDAGTSSISVITDVDAVYAVDDPQPRKAGDRLILTGATGGQGVATATGAQLSVVVDSAAHEKTLVTIGPDSRAGDPDEGAQSLGGGQLNAAVARAVVRQYRSHTGRGPTKAQAFYRNNVIVVLLEEMMTKAERSLISSGRADAVRLMREAFQESMRAGLIATVEGLTGTKVRAFLSTAEVEPDTAVVVFVLDAPVPGASAAPGEGDDQPA